MTEQHSLPAETNQTEKSAKGRQRGKGAASISREALVLRDGLTKAQRRLLDTEISREAAGKTNEEIAEMAGVNLATYYRAQKNEKYLAARRAMVERIIDVHLPSVVNASVRTASTDGKDGFNDRRMLLEVAKIYSPSQNITHSGVIKHEHEVGDRLGKAIFDANAHRRRMQEAEEAGDDAPPMIDVTPQTVSQDDELAPVVDDEFAPI